MRLFVAILVLLISPFTVADSDWSDDIIYFAITDRFADGDSSNNLDRQPKNPGGFHGGDLKGLTEQLPEIAGLGVTAIWITPIQKQINKPVFAQTAETGPFEHWGFHGYWIDDFEQIEPRLGNKDDLKNFVDAAHRLGLKVLLDVVYNHTGYGSSYQKRLTRDGKPWIRVGEGDCAVDPVTCRVGGLPDLKTEVPEIRDYLMNTNIQLAKLAGVDGFRLDTYKHVDREFWQLHRQRTREELGDDFFLLAEYWGGDYKSLDPFFADDEINAGIDFSFKGSCESFVNGRGRPIAFASYLGKRHKVRKGHYLAHYLSSHDETMGLYLMDKDVDKFRLCAAVQMTSLGIPVIYYGEEVARSGGAWPFNRKDMPWGEREIEPGAGQPRNEMLRAFYQKLIKIRREHSALTRGTYHLLSQRQDSLLAYARYDVGNGDAAVVLVNRDEQKHRADYALPENITGVQQWVDLISGEPTTQKQGRLQIGVDSRSVRILVPQQGKD
jgi:alpha-amylase